ncbi:MAG: hypothetical protein ABSG43_13210 [Solirubrobacteraceae bacterium]|jgi:hypothetical protein
MLLRHRARTIEPRPAEQRPGFEHLEDDWITMLRWLHANRVEYVLVGPVADAIRGNVEAKGPVAIVPAPYGRNFERLSRALWSAHARLRVEGTAAPPGQETLPVKLSAEKLGGGERWTLRCGAYDLDIEGRPAGAPSYQELLYEAVMFDPAPDAAVEVASPEDLEHYAYVRRTGVSPEIRITRNAQVESG